MLKRYHYIVGGVFRIVDAGVIGAAWLLAYWARFDLSILRVTKGFPAFSTYAALTPLVVILWMLVLSWLGVYQSRRMLRRTHEAQLLAKAHFAALLLFIAVTYFFAEYKYSRGVMLSFGLGGLVALVSFRLALRNALRSLRRRGFNLRHVLVVGEGQSAITVIERLNRFPELGLRVLGVVVHAGSRATQVLGRPVLGIYGGDGAGAAGVPDAGRAIAELVRSHGVDQVLIALPRADSRELDGILAGLREEMVSIQLVPDVQEYVTLGCVVEDYDGLPIVNLNDSPLGGWGAVAKRLTDIALSALALIVLSPVLLLIGLAVRLTSPGPVLYRQERMGLDGKTFGMLKFRSMRVDAEKESGAVWAKKGDDRRTPIGAFLRSTSLDELPQFWNVLRGEMSLVGPRPERPVFVRKFRSEIPHYMLRHKVKAGITGWAQVNGWRGDTSLDRRIECDLFYIRNWSYFLDWKILFLTLWKGFVNKNAY